MRKSALGQTKPSYGIALIGALAVILSSGVWGPPICRAVGICQPDPTPPPVIPSFPPASIPTFPGGQITPFDVQPAEIFLSLVGGPTGSTVNVSGHGFAPGETVVIRFHTTQVATTKASPTGAFANVAIVVPASFANFAPAQFNVVASGSSSLKSARAPFEVSG